ncbi:hypothetical protein Leryth_004297 [Lithospermum erythrorhizon]|nr:hypothetical protein Leryth_004297 [Lithospermum erythrorhizon]
MMVNPEYTRTGTVELRDAIFRKIGQQRAEKYFDILRRLFSLRISKIEFNKLCVRTIGRENLSLHNRLIKSIIKNACLGKVPPPKLRKAGNLFGNVADGHEIRTSIARKRGAFPVDRDHNYRDGSNPIGEEVSQRVQEQQSATELLSVGSRPPIEGASTEDGEEVEQFAGSPAIQSRSPVTAPIGISMNMAVARKAIRSRFGSGSTVYLETCQTGGFLPDTRSLRIHLEKKLLREGIGTSVNSVNLLNNGIDVYMKRLIEPCIAMARARFGTDHLKQISDESTIRRTSSQIIPGFNGMVQGRIAQKPEMEFCANMIDFRVSVESNPRMLGEDWSMQLEKICTRAME